MIKLYDKGNPPERLAQIAACLNDGGVIIFPTGTTYALGCHALKERAVERICRIRGIHPAEHPLSIICYDMSSISEYAKISTPAYKLMKRNLPGPFTFILSGKNVLPKIFRSRKVCEIGIRMPELPLLRELIAHLGAPLMASSLPPAADLSDMAYYTDPELVNEAFGASVDLVIDGGMGKLGQTTIVNCKEEPFEIVRQGDGILL